MCLCDRARAITCARVCGVCVMYVCLYACVYVSHAYGTLSKEVFECTRVVDCARRESISDNAVSFESLFSTRVSPALGNTCNYLRKLLMLSSADFVHIP